MPSANSIYAVVPAAGSGSRMGKISSSTKLFLEVSKDTTVLELCLKNLVTAAVCDGIVVAVRESELKEAKEIAKKFEAKIEVVVGGNTRQASVFNCLEEVKDKATHVLVHDGARPFCDPENIRQVCYKALEKGAAILAVPVTSTLKKVNAAGVIEDTTSRDGMWEAQTPQVFRFKMLYEAHLDAVLKGVEATDDSQLVEMLGGKVCVVEGSRENVKITRPEDLKV